MEKKNIIKNLLSVVPKKNIIVNISELSKYNNDWRGFYNFKALCVVFPINTLQISKILKFCNTNNIKVVPQSGNTSLTGASVPSEDEKEIIINLSKMNKILSIDKNNMLVSVESGVILDHLKKYVEKNNFYFPLSLSSSGSCLLGGNVATNAGGINVLKYGTVRDSLQGLEVVLADGTIITNMSLMKKDNTGYDIKNLFCGSEGTLGIISKILFKVYPKPNDYFHCFFGFKSTIDTINFFKELRFFFNDDLESAEIIPEIAFEITIKKKFLKNHFFDKPCESYLLCKFTINQNKKEFQNILILKLNKFNNKYKNVIIPQSIEQENKFWKFRDSLVESYKLEGKYITNDISLPIDKLDEFINTATLEINKLIPGTRIYSFGHLGDGNIHFNMIEPYKFNKDFDKYRNKIYNIVNDLVFKNKGSFSAEHGIGMIKRNSLIKYKSKNEIDFMIKIKKIFDPKNILNPNKLLSL